MAVGEDPTSFVRRSIAAVVVQAGRQARRWRVGCMPSRSAQWSLGGCDLRRARHSWKGGLWRCMLLASARVLRSPDVAGCVARREPVQRCLLAHLRLQRASSGWCARVRLW